MSYTFFFRIFDLEKVRDLLDLVDHVLVEELAAPVMKGQQGLQDEILGESLLLLDEDRVVGSLWLLVEALPEIL